MSDTTDVRDEAREGQAYTVGEWVANHPQTARIFERLGIDYCCAGRRSLEEACGRKGIDPAQVRAELIEHLRLAPPAVPMDWNRQSVADLIANIESSHHHYIRTEKQRLIFLAVKVARVHGDNHPELERIAENVIRLYEELEPHLEREEKDFFPACEAWGGKEAAGAPDPALLETLRALEKEHTAVGGLLESIRELASGFQPPPDACNSYLALFHGLEQLEADLHEHIHKENNILHSRILAGAGKPKGGAAIPGGCCDG
jgi:regulator of cell morphogenesis and NO signaling